MKIIKRALIIMACLIGMGTYWAIMDMLLDEMHWLGIVMLLALIFGLSVFLALAFSADEEKKETTSNTEQHGNKET